MRFVRHPLIITLCLVLSLAGGQALAQDSGKKDPKKKPTKAEQEAQKSRGGTMSPTVAKKLAAAQELLQAEKTNAAEKELAALLKRRGLKDIEKASIYYLMGFVANDREDTNKAIAWFTKAIKEDVLPLAQQYSLEYNVAQLYMVDGKFERALKILRSWFKKARAKNSPVTPNGGNYYMLALCYMNQPTPNVKSARRPAELAVEVSDKPQENWLRMLGQIYYQLKEYDKLAGVLERLIEEYNKAEYYTQLSGAYNEAGQDMNALAVMQLAHRQGLLTKESQIRQLTQMYLYQSIPYRAAQVMEKGFEDGLVEQTLGNYQLLADSWIGAREAERSFEPLSAAASLSDSGDLYMRLGQAYVAKQLWQEADSALGSALEKGDLKDTGNTHLLRGLARMNRERWQSARASFEAAEKFESSKSSASQYKRYLEQRKQQVEALRN